MTTNNLPAAISTLIANLEEAQAHSPAVMDNDFLFLKLTKFGEWVYGGHGESWRDLRCDADGQHFA